MAMLSSLASFAHVIGGLTNAGLREHMVALYDTDYSSGQATYDLRRLRLKGLICRVEGTHTYCVTDHGRRIATFFTKLATRVVVPALTELEAPARPPRQAPTALRTAWRAYDAEVRKLLSRSGLAA
jgi:predicted MarR family transcription regulator